LDGEGTHLQEKGLFILGWTLGLLTNSLYLLRQTAKLYMLDGEKAMEKWLK